MKKHSKKFYSEWSFKDKENKKIKTFSREQLYGKYIRSKSKVSFETFCKKLLNIN